MKRSHQEAWGGNPSFISTPIYIRGVLLNNSGEVREAGVMKDWGPTRPGNSSSSHTSRGFLTGEQGGDGGGGAVLSDYFPTA